MHDTSATRPRVLYILYEFPQLSQTYILAEIEALRHDYDLRIIALKSPDRPLDDAPPHEVTNDVRRMDEIVREFRPQIIHTHYLFNSEVVRDLAERHALPFTIRTHSFDVMPAYPRPKTQKERMKRLRRSARLASSDHCMGILAFPFTRSIIEKAGYRGDKLIDCYPVVDFERFYTPSAPTSDAVMNVGACLEKKQMEDFIDLAVLMPGREFNLYPVGYETDAVRSYNDAHGAPVNFKPVVQPADMRAEYRAHGWLVYTARPKLRGVGWPMAIAEAQAAGLGVCMPRLGPDLEEFMGGAGFLYDSVDELPPILSQPYPDEMRERGWEQARKSDIRGHLHLLTDCWDRALDQPATRWQPRGLTRFLPRFARA